MRSCLILLLIGLILSCPILCGTMEAGHAAQGPHPTSGSGDHSDHSDCPQDGDDCICRGAIASAAIRIADLDILSLVIPLDGWLAIPATAPLHSYVHLTSDGTPAGLAGWGDALIIRAWLQDYRC